MFIVSLLTAACGGGSRPGILPLKQQPSLKELVRGSVRRQTGSRAVGSASGASCVSACVCLGGIERAAGGQGETCSQQPSGVRREFRIYTNGVGSATEREKIKGIYLANTL